MTQKSKSQAVNTGDDRQRLSQEWPVPQVEEGRMPAEFDANQKLNEPQAASPAVSSPSENDDELMWELLSLYADGEASPEEAAQVEQMLRHDAEYAHAYSFLQKAGGAIRTIVEIEPPAHLRDAILAKTTHKPTLSRRVAAIFGTFRTQWSAPVGRLAFAGGGLAAAALVVGIYAGRTNNLNSAAAPAAGTVARTTANRNSSVASSNDKVPVYILPTSEDFLKTSTPLPSDAVKPVGGNNALAATRPDTVPNFVAAPLGPKLEQAGPSINPMSVAMASKVSSKPAPLPEAANKTIASKSGLVRLAKGEVTPVRHAEARTADDSSGTQNVNPMMDAAVQHRTAPMVIASISPVGGSNASKSMSADMDDLNDNNVLIVHDATAGTSAATPDGDSPPESGHKIVGKLMLSKLPPSSRHLMSPADAIREANSRSLVSYNATSSEEAPRRSADVPVLKGSF